MSARLVPASQRSGYFEAVPRRPSCRERNQHVILARVNDSVKRGMYGIIQSTTARLRIATRTAERVLAIYDSIASPEALGLEQVSLVFQK